MKTYIISLKRAKSRYSYIKNHASGLFIDYEMIDAVDGNLLTENDIKKYCDVGAVNKQRYWLTDGAIGCALSHRKAYEQFVKTNEKCAFIIEDDAALPENINEILEEIEKIICEDDLILLYYTSFKPAKLSTVERKELKTGNLYYPMNISQTITATAYVIGHNAAVEMIKSIIPIRVAADSWHYYYDKGCFDSFMVQYPMLVKTKNFKSSINYFQNNKLKTKISEFINTFKIPPFYQILAYRRKRLLNKMTGNFFLTNEISPILKNMIRNK